jgi:nitrogen-specific signal transduction histidine kinase
VSETAGRAKHGGVCAGGEREPLERQLLAFDALSKLTRQFCQHPDFEQLMDVLLMTLCGQFSIADCFALLKKPSAQSLNKSFFATGRFRRDIMIPSLQVEPEDWGQVLAERRVQSVDEFDLVDEATDQISVLARIGVSLLCPLVHAGKFFGIIGLGRRVTGAAYTDEDIDLLNTIIDAVTPLVANSYLFWDIASLNTWYLDILNNVRQGVFVFDKHFRLRKVNSSGLDILNAFRDDSSGSKDVECKPIDEVFPEPVFRGWAKRFMESRAARPVARSTLVAGKDSDEHIYNVTMTTSVGNSDIGTALIITLDDVTVQKTSEHRLFDLQKLADKGLLASSISHELNNFLALILGGLELTEFALEAGDKNKAASNIAKIKSHVGNMERFTKGLVDFATPDPAKRLGSLKSTIEDVLSFLSVQKRFKGIKIESDVGVGTPEFSFDPDQMAQLLLNLLHNAADAIHEAGIENGLITIEARRVNEEVVLKVSDNGAGIAPEVKERLFKTRLTTKTSGHGYGLMTCADIVSDHNGTIEISSEPEAGSTFTVRLPIGSRT